MDSTVSHKSADSRIYFISDEDKFNVLSDVIAVTASFDDIPDLVDYLRDVAHTPEAIEKLVHFEKLVEIGQILRRYNIKVEI